LYARDGWKVKVLDELIAIIKRVTGIQGDFGKNFPSTNKLNIIVRSIGYRTILVVRFTAAQVGEWSTYVKISGRDCSN
jgi:hypothetical protein